MRADQPRAGDAADCDGLVKRRASKLKDAFGDPSKNVDAMRAIVAERGKMQLLDARVR